tara:strand:- start:2393 stop:2908 length:516 start_codon:yes stop_codon:yes gene_type:complete
LSIERLYKKHKYWISVVKSFGENYYAEDVVQEAYIKVNGKEINDSYFYLTLRSITMDLHRKKVDTVEISFLNGLFDVDDTEEIKFFDDPINHKKYFYHFFKKDNDDDDIDKKVEMYKEILSTFEWYDRDLFMLYANSGMSMRKIARETNISFTSIYNTIKKCKEKLKNQKD